MSNDTIPIDTKKRSDKVDMIVTTANNAFGVFSVEHKPWLVTDKVACETIKMDKDRRVNYTGYYSK